MKSWIIFLFVQNWKKKTVSLLLAIAIWTALSYSMTTNRKIENIQVRVINLAPGKTFEGMKTSGILHYRIPTLSLTGNKASLEKLTDKDLEVVIDAQHLADKTKAEITKRNLVSLNPELDIAKAIDRIAPFEIPLKPTNLVTSRIPVIMAPPTGDPPKGYQFLDIWPYQLSVTVTGPEETVQQLKSRGVKLTLNLSEISSADLDAISSHKTGDRSDEISFPVPESLKKLNIPMLSETPIPIEDPQAKFLRIDFLRQEVIPIGVSLPVSVFFPLKFSNTINPETYTLATNDLIVKKNGIKLLSIPLYAQGVSRLFFDIVKDMLQIVITAVPKTEQEQLSWILEFMDYHNLENRYIARSMSVDGSDAGQPRIREEVLRNRFRSYMNRLRLFTSNDRKLYLKIELQANTIAVSLKNP